MNANGCMEDSTARCCAISWVRSSMRTRFVRVTNCKVHLCRTQGCPSIRLPCTKENPDGYFTSIISCGDKSYCIRKIDKLTATGIPWWIQVEESTVWSWQVVLSTRILCKPFYKLVLHAIKIVSELKKFSTSELSFK